MPAAATDLYDAARELLEASSDAIAAGPGGAILVAFVSPGVPALDCEQITVHAGGPREAPTLPLEPPLQPGHRDVPGRVNLAALTVTIARCVPTINDQGEPPSPSESDTAARTTLGDAWVVFNHLFTLRLSQQLFPCRAMYFDDAVPLALEGGIGGWELPFRIQVDGFRTVL